MRIWQTLKETIVGIHADYHTNFDRLREKYKPEVEEPKPEPSVLTREFVQTMTGIGKSTEMREELFGVDGVKRRAQPSPRVIPEDSYEFSNSPGSSIPSILSQLKANGWSNLAVTPSFPGEGLMIVGNYGEEYGSYEVVLDSHGKAIEVRTHDSVRKLQ